MLPAAAKALNELKPALTRLAALKNAVALTPFALETWIAGLSVFDPAIVNEACLRIAVSPDPWPDFGKVFATCEEVRRRLAGSRAAGVQPSIDQSLRKVAAALQLTMPTLEPSYHQAPRNTEMPA